MSEWKIEGINFHFDSKAFGKFYIFSWQTMRQNYSEITERNGKKKDKNQGLYSAFLKVVLLF